jgi:23S rRNA (cytosine1962-C5)-methyltransferase
MTGAGVPALPLDFAPFDPARILFEDDDLLVVDKPARVSSQAANPDLPDDLVTRLQAFLRARGDRSDYLGTHQRLDQDTSGVILFTRRKSANAPIARAFEHRVVEKRYVAGVAGGTDPPPELRHFLRSVSGRSEIVDDGTSGAQLAVTRVLDARRRDGRALLDLRIETGRTHQIRAQLAHVGCPVAGDGRYGASTDAAPRLLLHASELRAPHPTTGEVLTFRAPEPRIFARWLDGAPCDLWDGIARAELLRDAVEARWGLGHRARASSETTAFRLVHGTGDGLGGLAVDYYAGFLVAHVYRDLPVDVEAELLDALDTLGAEGVYLKRRPIEARTLDPAAIEARAPHDPVRGDRSPDPWIVREHGVPFPVRLGDGLSTGLFLEHRENRRRIAELARGKSVLNLFAYTCGFALAAAWEGARSTESVDVAERALRRGEDAFRAAELVGDHRFLREDVFEFLRRAIASRRVFDVVVCDPPTFATTRTSRFASGKDIAGLAGLVLRVVAPSGVVLFGSNDERLSWRAFRRFVRDGAREAGVTLDALKDLRPPSDFPASPGAEAHPKALLGRVSATDGRGRRPAEARGRRSRPRRPRG